MHDLSLGYQVGLLAALSQVSVMSHLVSNRHQLKARKQTAARHCIHACAGLKLNQHSMDLMRALLLLEDRLCAAMEFQPAEPWGLMAALEPALFKWTIDKLELLQGWMQRLMSDEAWKPVTKPQGCAR